MGKSKKRHSEGTGSEGATEKPDAVSGDIFHKSLEELKQALDILGFEITPKSNTVAQTISSPIADVIKESRKRKVSSSSNTETDNEPRAKKHKHRKHHKVQAAATDILLPAANSPVEKSTKEMPLMNSTPLKAGKFLKSVPTLIFSSQSSSSDLDFSLAKMSPLNSSKRLGNKFATGDENSQTDSEKSAKKANKRKSKEGKTTLPSDQLGKPVKEGTVSQKYLSPSAFGGDWTRQELAAVDAKKLNLLEKYFVGKNKKEKTPTNKQKTAEKKDGDTNLNPVVIGSPEKKDRKKSLSEGKVSPAKKTKVDSVILLSAEKFPQNTKTKQIAKSPKKHPTNQEITPHVTLNENTKNFKKHKKQTTSSGIEANGDSVSLATESQPEESASQESQKKSHKKKKKKSSKTKEEEDETLKESSPIKIVSFSEFIGNDVETNSAAQMVSVSEPPKKYKKSKARDKQENITPENLGENTQTIIQSKIKSKKSTKSEKLKTNIIESKQETEKITTSEPLQKKKKKSKKKRKLTENESLDNIKPNVESVNQNQASPVVSKVTKNMKGKSDKESVVNKSKGLTVNKSSTTTQNSAVAKDSKTAKGTQKKSPSEKKVPPKKEVNVVKALRPTAKSKRPTAAEQRFRKTFNVNAWEEKMKMIELLTSGDSGEKSESEVSTPTYIERLGMFSFEPEIGNGETKTSKKTKKKKKKKDKEK